MSAANKLVLLCILTTAAAAFLDETFVVQNLAFSTDNLLEGRLWTLVTSLFLHANLLHLPGNIIFLYVFGNTLEKIRSLAAMVGAFLYGGVLSFLLGLFFYPAGTSLVGASARHLHADGDRNVDEIHAMVMASLHARRPRRCAVISSTT